MPFGPFDDFEDCVERMSQEPSVDDPEALCARLHHDWTGQWPAEKEHPEMDPAVKQTPGSIDWVRGEISRRVASDGWVREMFTDRAIVEDGSRLLEVDWEMDGDDLVLGEAREVTVEYVAKAEGGPRLTGPIVRKDTAKRIAYAPVLVPGEPDADGEVLTAEKVEEVAHTWLETFQAIDRQHSVKAIDASPVESFIEPADREVTTLDGDEITIPAGTWTMAAKVRDDGVWDEIEAGERTGFSVMGVPRASLEQALKSVKSGDTAAMKRVTLADVGGGDANGDWVAPFVSIVDKPAVPKAKFFALKAAPSDDPGLLDRLKTLVGAGKEGRRFSNSTFEQLKKTAEAINALVAEAEKEREGRAGKARDQEDDMDQDKVQELVSGAVKSALEEQLAPIAERIDALEEAAGKNDDPDETGETEVDAAIKTAIDEAVSPLTEQIERLEERTRAGSNQPDDTGDAPANKSDDHRDPFGRRIA